MLSLTFEEVLRAVQQLSVAERKALLYSLQSEDDDDPTREQIIAELIAQRAAGVFHTPASLRGRYARPDVQISDAELNAYLHEVGSAWKEDLEQLDAKSSTPVYRQKRKNDVR